MSSAPAESAPSASAPIEMPRAMFRVAERIAALAHEVNRGYCAAIGDPVQPSWPLAPAWQKRSCLAGVDAALRNPALTPQESHAGWLREKVEQGWTYGAVKDSKARTHPCCVPYEALPRAQRVKDYLFLAVVRALSQELPGALPPMEAEPAVAGFAHEDVLRALSIAPPAPDEGALDEPVPVMSNAFDEGFYEAQRAALFALGLIEDPAAPLPHEISDPPPELRDALAGLGL